MRLDFHPVRNGFHFALPALTIPELDDAFPNSAEVDSRTRHERLLRPHRIRGCVVRFAYPRDCND
jgi:hypothetical protein